MRDEPTRNTGHARRRGVTSALIAAVSITAALGLSVYHYIQFSSRVRALPLGATVAGIPVGGLSEAQAAELLEATYLAPIDVTYRGHTFQLLPAEAGFELEMANMLATVRPPESARDGLPQFWDYLWGRQPTSDRSVSLQATYSPERLQNFLEEVSQYYDEPAHSPWADPEQLMTIRGTGGIHLDRDAAAEALRSALFSREARTATLVGLPGAAAQPTIDLLEQQIRDFLALQEFDGLFSLYLVDMRTDERVHMNLWQGQDIATDPDVAYSGMSIMKIYILTEFYRQLTDGALPYELDLVEKSITESSNWTSNLLIEWIGDLDAGSGLYRLNETIAALGLQGTFIGGLYDTEEPPGFRYTPSNTREDINTAPDPYMQTTPSDIGRLLEGIYRCAEFGDGLLIETFGDQFTAQECQDMIGWLTSNRIGVLIEAGVPGGTPVAHKHGWAEGEPIGDAGIVLTDNGDYVLVYYVWYPEYTYWDENSSLLADVSRAVYNYINPITP